MCNCGNKRNEDTHSSFSGSGAFVTKRNQLQKGSDLNFKYTGKTALSVTGSITGKRYRFSFPGNIQTVDYRDATGMRTVPLLSEQK